MEIKRRLSTFCFGIYIDVYDIIYTTTADTHTHESGRKIFDSERGDNCTERLKLARVVAQGHLKNKHAVGTNKENILFFFFE